MSLKLHELPPALRQRIEAQISAEDRALGKVICENKEPEPVATMIVPAEDYALTAVRKLKEVNQTAVVCRGIHLGEPMPKQRPRFSPQGHAYTPQSTKDHQKSLASVILSQCSSRQINSSEIFGVRAIFYVQTHQRKDVDNLLKTLLDALNKIVFVDDSQVKELMGWSVLDLETPRTEFVVYSLGRMDRDKGFCVRCGKAFRQYKSWKNRLFCSRSCWSISQRNGKEVSCFRCGKVFVRTPGSIKEKNFCSSVCWNKENSIKRKTVKCDICGKLIVRPISSFKRNQRRHFCSMPCRITAMTGLTSSSSKDELSTRSKKGWATRRLKFRTVLIPDFSGSTDIKEL